MNISAKCNCCVRELICKYSKELYQKGVESIFNTTIHNYDIEGHKGSSQLLKECSHIEVSIECPRMITHTM